ncbi:hypothetical protein SBF1_9200001 [Candidatus Desulfosporosinus infrequens]|uniref:Uncharacterized protein n=1 Tax=Candidatus Desulfosporosinus infrequens TaxID=2043169 RepID=A0A2U3LX53_9FIRM|nr:hypothetical protein SBF1_9200001 [Candidatus Desulfosporosinus infrequens]
MTESNRGGARKGAGRTPLDDALRKKGHKIYLLQNEFNYINKYGMGTSFSEKVVEILLVELERRKC